MIKKNNYKELSMKLIIINHKKKNNNLVKLLNYILNVMNINNLLNN